MLLSVLPLLRLEEVASQVGSAAFVSLAWAQHPAAEAESKRKGFRSEPVRLSCRGQAFTDFSLKLPEVVDGSFFLRDRQAFENQARDRDEST